MATTNPAEYVFDYDGERLSSTGRHAIAETLWNNREFRRNNTMGRTYVTITPIEGLNLTANYGLDISEYRRSLYENPLVGDGVSGAGRLNLLSTRSTTQTFNQLISYAKSFGVHAFDVLLGHENYKYEYNSQSAMKVGETFSGIREFPNFATISSASSYTDNYRKESYFGRLNYDYDDRYYASFSFRRDASSRFAPDNRWGTFKALGVSWRISQEDFLKGLTWLDDLKIKASVGESGNDFIGTYRSLSPVADYYPYQSRYDLNVNNGSEAGIFFSSLSNPNIKWETQVSKDAGIEFAIFNRKLTGGIELFEKSSRDLLFSVSKAISTGVGSMMQNIGKVRNRGVEIDLNYQVLKNKDWSVALGTNATFVKNKLIELPEENRASGIISGYAKLMEGRSIYEFWLRQWYGVDPNTGNGLYYLDTDAYNATNNTLTSAVQNTLVTGPNGEQLTNSYQYAKLDFSGSAIPKVTGGFHVNVSYRDFDFTALFSYSLGSKIYDLTYANLMSMSNYGSAMHTDVQGAWRQVGDITDVPRLDASATHSTNVDYASTRWLVSGDYLNFRSLSIGYNVPTALLSKVQLKRAKVNLTAENLGLLKARQGLNPMANYSGVSYNEYMPVRTITLGLNLSF